MSIALQLLIGGALFAAVYSTIGWTGVGLAACVLVAVELIHDLRLYRQPKPGGLRLLWLRLRYGLRLERMGDGYILRSTRSLSKRDFDRVRDHILDIPEVWQGDGGVER